MERTKKLFTLIIIEKDDLVLLAMKKRGFGADNWNGYGGKVEVGETITEAAVREVVEESGLVIKEKDLELRGTNTFQFPNDPVTLEVHLFSLKIFSGEPKETEEMRHQWFLKNEIQYDEMWEDDRYWMPLFLEGKSLSGRYVFDKDQKLLKKTITVL